MSTWIALFRGINVGGHRRLPMKELVTELEKLGLQDVKTYIQSGNAIFHRKGATATSLSNEISQAIHASHGFRADVMVMSAESFHTIAAHNPFPDSEAAAKTVHLFFLAQPHKNADLSLLDAVQADKEEYHLDREVLYLYTPDGYRDSKLAQKIPKALGIPATARNWRTVTKILEIVEQIQ